MTWVDDVRNAQSLPELMNLYETAGGEVLTEEELAVLTWRKNELAAVHIGDHLTELSPAINQVFDDRARANAEFIEHGKLWAAADADLKRLQGKKWLFYKQTKGGPAAEVEAYVNDDEDVYKLRLTRNTNEAMLKTDYKVIELLSDRWEYLQSLMVTERQASAGPQR